MFACEHAGISPDLFCIAKGITGGYLPLAATLTSEEIFAAFLAPYEDSKTFFHGHTYTGNPLACAAALASLAVFEQEQVLGRRGNDLLSHSGVQGLITSQVVISFAGWKARCFAVSGQREADRGAWGGDGAVQSRWKEHDPLPAQYGPYRPT